jgi:phosphate:Na+ symporter
MEIYECILSLIAGVGVFILAMKLMSDSLNAIAGARMKAMLEAIAGNRFKGVLVGALVTAVIQSSSATTVMVIGFVNANVMDLNQAAAIIIGSNIGTTATALLASMESLNISLYLSLLVFIGVILAFIKKIKKVANLMVGLGMIFVGLKMMSQACSDDSIKEPFQKILQKIKFPLFLEILGVVFTAIIQSSSAMTGIVLIMVSQKVMDMYYGLFITLGANVGTCVTALLGIIGANDNSKRTAIIHLIFNISGCLLFTPILWIFGDKIIPFLKKLIENEEMQIAYFHLAFNTITAIMCTPMIEFLVLIAKWIIKDPEHQSEIDKLITVNENLDIDMNRNTTASKSELNALTDTTSVNSSQKGSNTVTSSEYQPPTEINSSDVDSQKQGTLSINDDSEKK